MHREREKLEKEMEVQMLERERIERERMYHFYFFNSKNGYFISARDRLQREEVEKRRREVRQDRFTQFRIFKIKFAFRNGSASNENEDFMKKMNSLSEGKLNKSKKNVLNENDSRFAFKYFASSLIYEF